MWAGVRPVGPGADVRGGRPNDGWRSESGRGEPTCPPVSDKIAAMSACNRRFPLSRLRSHLWPVPTWTDPRFWPFPLLARSHFWPVHTYGQFPLGPVPTSGACAVRRVRSHLVVVVEHDTAVCVLLHLSNADAGSWRAPNNSPMRRISVSLKIVTAAGAEMNAERLGLG